MIFPFTALVGQPLLQRALVLAAIDPGIGGVLVTGPRGTAKSTAARALAELLPHAGGASPSPFVTLPLSATLEQLVGTLDVEAALQDSRVRLAPGLLARAHGGVLYVDEVNLLPDALVDALLDAATSGVNTVERDGISHSHAARFVLVGTMNPEEGALRPQLLDRFGLSVALANPASADDRVAILRARLAFDAEPQALRALHAPQAQRLAAAIAAARAALARTGWPEDVLGHAAHLALQAGVDGVRADLVMVRAARALAAFEGSEVTPAHVDAVASLALAHRRHTPAEAPGPAPRAMPPSPSPPKADRPETPSTAGSMQAPAPRPSGAPAAAPAAPSGNHRPSAATEGGWGALPAQPEAALRIDSLGDWLPKKA
ncbi:ATP-binding protein [Aquincola sp. MAHUQ-54]|uniref:ATP-binding protein n=1 Tax=Aquincola agrisoli TaxID=3119538 RepID=A0AAW9QDL3_9BURK